jgi:hypothetical protein
MKLLNLADSLPPMLARERVEQALGGVISAKTLANNDSLGTGPKRFRVGRKVVYNTVDLLEWLENRTKYYEV